MPDTLAPSAPDPIASALARSPTIREIVMGAGVLAEAGALFARQFPGRTAVLIADANTDRAAGQAVADRLAAAGIAIRRHVLPAQPRPKPSVELSQALARVIGADDAIPVAVGSGVINDVVKYAAFLLDRPYLCVATAASMDGYSSAGAPLSQRGFKKTLAARPPVAILADLDVLAAAPPAMTGWGFGDLAGKAPAGGDWIIADALGVEPIDAVAWPMVQDPLRGWLAMADAVATGDRAAVAGLMTGLTLVGLAMEAHGTSRPASGADHQIAHLWEMEDHHHDGERVSHGACVSIGCVVALGLFDWLLGQDPGALDAGAILAAAPPLEAKAAEIDRAFSGELAARAKEETAAKHLSPAAHAARLADIARVWPRLRARLDAHVMRAPAMADLLARAGAPTRSEAIGITRAHLRRTVRASRFIRSRYTILDLLDETGLLPAAIDAVIPATEGAP